MGINDNIKNEECNLTSQDFKHMEDVLEENGVPVSGMTSDEVCEAYWKLFD